MGEITDVKEMSAFLQELEESKMSSSGIDIYIVDIVT